MKFKIGMVAWSCSVFEGKIEWDEWILRTIQRERRGEFGKRMAVAPGQRAYFIRKTTSTWVKQSKKHFDYGWACTIDAIDRCWAYVDSGCLPWGLYSTRLRAATALVKQEKDTLKRTMQRKGDDWDTERDECILECKTDLAAAKRNLARCRRVISQHKE